MSQHRHHQSSPDDEGASSNNGYPDFVAYHFVNPDGELLAMEGDGSNTLKVLQNGLSIDESSVGFAKVEQSDVKLIPEKDSYQIIQAESWQQARFLAHLVTEQGNTTPAGFMNQPS